jgi:ribose/xylose/arabinose/galactoside ABC-type transport system permease subunit
MSDVTIGDRPRDAENRVVSRLRHVSLGRHVGLLVALGICLVILGVRTDNYLTTDNVLVVSLQLTTVGLISIGSAVLLISGKVDLSIGSIFGFAAVSSVMLSKEISPPLAMVIAVTIAMLFGWINGLLVWRISISPIIITLGSLTLLRAALLLMTNGRGVRGVPDSFSHLGQARPLGVPIAVYVLLATAIVAHVLLSRTTIGQYIYAIGGNQEASEMVGLPVRRLVLYAFALNGLLAGVAGVLTASRFGSATPQFGFGLELDVLTAVILGGVAFQGGEGTIAGVMVAVVLLGVIRSGVVALGINPYYADIVQGGALIGAVVVDQLVHEQRERTRKRVAMQHENEVASEAAAAAGLSDAIAVAERRGV